jgi:hypothetical protein
VGAAPAASGDTAALGRRLRQVAGREIAFDDEGFFWDYDDLPKISSARRSSRFPRSSSFSRLRSALVRPGLRPRSRWD